MLYRFVQISDLHIAPRERGLLTGVDTADELRRVAAHIAESGIEPQAIILSGDIAHDGSPAAYEHARDVIDSCLRPLGAPLVFGVGNHDRRAAFREAFGIAGDGPIVSATDIGGVRFLMLDSLVEGADHGELSEWQLEWLREELRVPAAIGHVVIVHHPVFARGIPKAERYLQPEWRERLRVVLSASPPLGVLTGHAHAFGCAPFAGTVAVIAPAACWTSDPSNQGGMKVLAGGGYNFCAIRDGTMVVYPMPLPSDRRVLVQRPNRRVAPAP